MNDDMNTNTNTKIGAISLWASMGGIVILILITRLVPIFVKGNDVYYMMLCYLLFAGVELVALVTGIIGWRSAAGKAGLGISAVCMVITAVAIRVGCDFARLRATASVAQSFGLDIGTKTLYLPIWQDNRIR